MSEIAVQRYPPRYGDKPLLGPIEVSARMHDGTAYYGVRRAGAPAESELLLSEEALVIARYFNGERDLRGVQTALHRDYGQLLYCEKLHTLALALWNAGLLAPVRPPPPKRAPLQAGHAYELEPARLRAQLNSLFFGKEGPGALPGPRTSTRVRGILAPQLDPLRAGGLQAQAYRALLEGSDADLFVIFGVSHHELPVAFVPTRADYDTPLGLLRSDSGVLDQLGDALGERVFAHAAAHDREHSIEMQALYLRHLAGERPFTIVPVLCSPSTGPDDQDALAFLEVLRRAVSGRKVAFIAASDLSHLGLIYGDPHPPSPEILSLVAERDRTGLRHLEQGDGQTFTRQALHDGDSRRVYGRSTIESVMALCAGCRLRVLRYGQWCGAEEGSAVTFAAAVWETP